MTEIAYYTSVLHPKPKTVSLDGFITALRTGADKRVADTITKIRSLDRDRDKAEIEALKRSLPGVSFAGTFSSRANDKLIESSGLMTLDFDGKGEVPKELDKHTFLRFKSPQGGNREKVIVRIPLVKDNAQYRAYFNGMVDYIFDLTKPKGLSSDTDKRNEFRKSVESIVDLSGKDIARFCFMSHDPDLIYNPKAMIWDKRQEIKPKDPSTGVPREEPKKSNAYIVRRIVNMILKGKAGQRHETCRQAGVVAGGYIAGGALNSEEIEWLVRDPIAEINDGEDAGTKDDYRAFLSGVQFGKQYPLNEVHVKNIEEQLSSIVPDFIEDTHDTKVGDELDRIRAEGYTRGIDTGWDEFDNLYSVLEQTSTIIYSAPHIGKTIFIFNMMINICRNSGWRGIIFSPESGNTAQIKFMLIEIYLGKNGRETTEEEFAFAKAFVNENFYILNPDKDHYIPSPEDLLSMAEKIIAKDKKVKMLLIDTVGDTTVDFGDDRTDKNYIKMMIGLRQWFVNNYAHVFLTSHIIGNKSVGVDKSNGHQIFPIPHESQIKGGQALSQKGFNIIALYQYYPATQSISQNEEFIYNGKSFFRNSMYAIVQKIKPFFVGRRGSVHFLIDRETHRVVEYGDRNKTYDNYRDTTEAKSTSQQEIEYDPEWLREENPQGK